MTYRCGTCNAGFESKKPQDPQHDRGFGTCAGCRERHRQSAPVLRLPGYFSESGFVEDPVEWCEVWPEAYA